MIYALEQCENMEFFNNSVVQMIIDNQWAYWRPRSFIFLGAPMIVQLFVFVFWSNIVILNLEHNESLQGWETFSLIVLITISFYFMLMEIPLIYYKRISWLFELQSLVNVLTDIFMLINCFNPDPKS